MQIYGKLLLQRYMNYRISNIYYRGKHKKVETRVYSYPFSFMSVGDKSGI